MMDLLFPVRRWTLQSLFADQVRKPGRTKSKDTKVVWSGLPPYLNEQKPSFIF
ncbi:Hypothetical protein GbCGDNIH7_5036 [Granulibacter bethesdensis]|nr:Hypothetical protein GbCGDNIH7_5036 [Granulibacter bethesdensis]